MTIKPYEAATLDSVRSISAKRTWLRDHADHLKELTDKARLVANNMGDREKRSRVMCQLSLIDISREAIEVEIDNIEKRVQRLRVELNPEESE